jgi:hypothetical protein
MLQVLIVSVSLLAQQPAPAAADQPKSDKTLSQSPLAAYQELTQKTGRDAESQVRLALWCEANGLNAERVRHLARAVLTDPSNSLARGLLGLVADQGRWKRPDDVTSEIKNDPERQKILREYVTKSARIPDKADAHWKLALWCAEHGLESASRAQLEAVVAKDPHRDAAWIRLGYKKHGNRWVQPAQLEAEKAAADAQKYADRYWKPLLEKWRTQLTDHDPAKRQEAEQKLASITDPHALPSIWKVFITRQPSQPERVVQLLGQLDGPAASRALTLMAVFNSSPRVRGKAIELLRLRDPREPANLLVSLLYDKIKYSVKRVNGPGSAGELVIAAPDKKTRRIYSTPAAPSYSLGPNDIVTFDANGLPVISRPVITNRIGVFNSQDFPAQIQPELGRMMTGNEQASSTTPPIAGTQSSGTLNQQQRLVAALADASRVQQPPQLLNRAGQIMVGGIRPNTADAVRFAEIPVGQMAMAAEQTAMLAEQKLEADIKSLQSLNTQIDQANAPVITVLSQLCGQDLGSETEPWQKWASDANGYAFQAANIEDRYAEDEYVPLEVVPEPPIVYTAPVALLNFHHACFAAGTQVRTITGLKPIEGLRAGELILAQNTRTGALGYQPINTVYHNPPNKTLKLEFGDETIIATPIHRFWKAAKGWTMARDLKPGDRIRTLSGIAELRSISEEKVQPVFNLKISDGDNFFVGSGGLLVHDNSLIEDVAKPFDSVASITAPGPTKTKNAHGQ